MKDEAEFNSIVRKSFEAQEGFGYKIADTFIKGNLPIRGKAPFDGFGCASNRMVVWESKYLREPKAFNLQRLEDHQIASLLKVYDTFTDKDRIASLFLIGVNFGRGDIRVFYWKNEDLKILLDRKINKKSILKKEFESSVKYIPISKGLINFKEILE